MTDDFTPLTTCNHWLGWLGADPTQEVRDSIERMLREQVPSAKLNWIRLLGEPYFLTGGRRIAEEPSKIIATRAALAVAFELQVSADHGVETLTGVFSWVAAALDGANRRDRSYFDINAEMPWASDQLNARIYELDAESESPS
jgi:hypothetical protein